MTTPHEHWQRIYLEKNPTTVSWYQPTATRSLALIERVAAARDTPIIDVGGGASTLVDGLLGADYLDVTVLDIAAPALELSSRRLGMDAGRVRWITADILTADLPAAGWGLWHDRAAFHFLTDPDERRRYAAQLRHSLRPGGHAIIATFAPDGPLRCSGRDVQRWEADALIRELGSGFTLVESSTEDHTKPDGGVQRFSWAVMRFTDSAS